MSALRWSEGNPLLLLGERQFIKNSKASDRMKVEGAEKLTDTRRGRRLYHYITLFQKVKDQ